ncbi:MAG TPA: ATP-binding protein [Desulfobacterales bacterium]
MLQRKSFKPRGGLHQTSPGLIVGATLILLVVVVVLAVQNYNREKRYMSDILTEKGAAIIRGVEAGARTGMRHMMWGDQLVQKLLEETARLPGVIYMALIDADGRILAHSDPQQIGGAYPRDMQAAGSPDAFTWRIVTDPKGRTFEVYHRFQPLRPGNMAGHEHMMRRHGMMMGRRLPPAEERREIILAGLDVTPFEEARREDIRNTVIISAVLLLLGFGGLVSMFWAQSYRTTRRTLQDTSAFADEVVSNLPVGLIATDRNGKIAFFNDAAETITGKSAAAAMDKDPDAVLPSCWCGLKAQLEAGGPVLEKEMECAFAERRQVPLAVSAARIVNEEGRFVGNIIILRDLGEIRRLQEEIRRQEKLAALGGLAAGVAHEIRNPLSSIKGIATYFGSRAEAGSQDREAAEVMVQEVDRLNRVITELLEFARPSELRRQPVELAPLLAHSVRLIEQDARTRQIEVRLENESEPLQVALDPDRFSQCLLNLYLNAIESMDRGGRLTVKSRKADDGEVRIEIADTGSGIAPEHLSQIFDPYFTTKSKGTGLGLAIVHKLIEAHNGRIKVRSTPGAGSVVTIFLPVQS